MRPNCTCSNLAFKLDRFSKVDLFKMASCGNRRDANILITGTPGTGKSLLALELCERAAMTLINIGNFAKIEELFDGWDEELQCHILDEDRVGIHFRDIALSSCLDAGILKQK